MAPNTRTQALLLLVVLTLLWGTNWPLFRLVLEEVSVWQFRAAVVILASAVLMLAALLRGERLAVPAGRWPALIAASFTNITIWFIATALAVQHLPSGHAAVLGYTMPLWLALFAVLFLKERFTIRMLLALGFGAAAVALLMAKSFGALAGAPTGLAAGLIAAAAWAIGTLVVKRTDWGGLKLGLTAWQMTLAIPPLVLGQLLLDDRPWTMPGTTNALVTLYIAVIPIAIGTLTWFAIVDRVPAHVAGLSSISVPVVAVISGVMMFDEPMGPMQAAALVCTIVSLWLAILPGKPVMKPAEKKG